MRVKSLLLAALTALALTPAPVFADSAFSPVVFVNDSAISQYELEQRALLLQAFGLSGDLQAQAEEQLIDDRLKAEVIRAAGLRLDEANLQQAMSDFAARANLDLETFLARLGEQGIASETLRDFVISGVTWKAYVEGRFGPRVVVSDADIDAAIGMASADTAGFQVLLSEIIMPTTPETEADVMAKAREISAFTRFEDFAAAAAAVSALPTAQNGGALDWAPVSNYPEGLRNLLLNLKVGQVTPPLPINGGIALLQLRDIRESGSRPRDPSTVSYAILTLPGGQSPEALAEAAAIANRAKNCMDLYGEAFGLPEDRLTMVTESIGATPRDIAAELARLDQGEVSTALTRNDGQTLLFLMLCGRAPTSAEPVDRNAVRGQILAQRLSGLADAYLADLRAAATIRRP